jgi:hemerythrin-like metal-binding protein
MLQAHADAITLTQQVEKILASKAAHFATEEKYFHQFNFDGTAEHERLHRDFSEQIAYLQKEYASDINMLSAKLVDFLALWLVGHLMGVDQKYKQCFKDGGLQ